MFICLLLLFTTNKYKLLLLLKKREGGGERRDRRERERIFTDLCLEIFTCGWKPLSHTTNPTLLKDIRRGGIIVLAV